MKKRALCLLTALLAGLLAACAFAPAANEETQPILLRYADNQPDDYPTTQAAYRFAELVEQRTDGRIKILVYGDAELGDELSVIEQLQLGMVDFARASLGTLSDINGELAVLQLPFLYEDADQMWRVLDGDIGREYLDCMEEDGIVGLSWFDAGARSFYTTAGPITSLEQLSGLVLRVQESSMMEDMVRALGAQPVQLIYSDVYSALQSGAIDGAENNWPSYESMKHYEVAPYFVLDAHVRIPEMQIASSATMQSLSAEDQEILRQAAQESAEYERQLWVEKEKESEAIGLKAGVKVNTLSDEELQKFRDAVAPLYDVYGAGQEDVIAAIRAS